MSHEMSVFCCENKFLNFENVFFEMKTFDTICYVIN